MYQTPFRTMFGIEIIANAINTVIMNQFIIRFRSSIYFVIILIIAIFVSFLSAQKSIFNGFVSVFVFLIVYYILAAVLFSFYNIVFNNLD